MLLTWTKESLCILVALVVNCQSTKWDTVQEVMEAVQGNSHLPAIAELGRIPIPLSTGFNSFTHNTYEPCQKGFREPFRRASGVCNNLRHPFQGAVLDTEKRVMDANTYLDGRSIPRIQSLDGHPLPSAREVSLRCFGQEEDNQHYDPGETDGYWTQLIWQFGQLVFHDISHVQTFDGRNNCCDGYRPGSTLFTQSRPDQCFPIAIPPNDPFFNDSCMIFTRSYAADVFDVREPINGVTSYVDASPIYGSSLDAQRELRWTVSGLLKGDIIEGQEQLPIHTAVPCQKPPQLEACPFSGDERVNVQAGLAAIHTLFHGEHNRIARKLFQLNSHWDDERLFQETRKIIIGIFQKIVYEDYLPLLIGLDVLDAFVMRGPYVYDDSLDTRTILEFATAGARYGHTLVNTRLLGQNFSDVFHVPVTNDRSNARTILFHMANSSSHLFNNRFTSQLRDHLFKGITDGASPYPGPSFDLTALNIQRGRDHGIATYTTVRDYCYKTLKGVPGFDYNHLPDCYNDGVYRHQEDIDLYVGGVSEQPLPHAVLGHTFACLAGHQFFRLRCGDRFFYEATGHEGFTPAQLAFIRQNTLATLMCELDPTGSLQRDVFRHPSRESFSICVAILENQSEDVINANIDFAL